VLIFIALRFSSHLNFFAIMSADGRRRRWRQWGYSDRDRWRSSKCWRAVDIRSVRKLCYPCYHHHHHHRQAHVRAI